MVLRALAGVLVVQQAVALSELVVNDRPKGARRRASELVADDRPKGARRRAMDRAQAAAKGSSNQQPRAGQSLAGAPVFCPADPPDEIAGEYEIWYNGQKRSTTMTISCENLMREDTTFNSYLHFVNASSKACKQKMDQDATIYVSTSREHHRHACLYREGTSLKGNHYVGDVPVAGGVEYRLIKTVYCQPRKLPSRKASGGGPTACNPETRVAALQELTNHFDSVWNARVAEAFDRVAADAYLLIGDWHSGPLVGNWLAHAKGVAESSRTTINVIHVALDQAGAEGCRNFIFNSIGGKRINLDCVSLSGWLSVGHALFSRSDVAGHGVLAGCDSAFLGWTKPMILKAAVEASKHAVMMVDPDVIMYTDLMPLGADLLNRSNGATIVAGVEGNGQANSGTVYATKKSLPVLSAWVHQNNGCLNSKEVDKSALQLLVYNSRDEKGTQEACHDAEKGDKCYKKVTWAKQTGVLQHPEWYPGLNALSSHEEFQHQLHGLGKCPKPCGGTKVVLTYFPGSEVGQCQRKGRAATHFNCGDPKKKASVMKSMKHWDPAISMNAQAILIQPHSRPSLKPIRK
jgi:hypothetical protein